MVATWLAADCGGQLCMAAAGRRRTSSGMTALARWAASRLFLGLWWRGVVVLYGVELSCTTVLMSQSNWLLFESSLEWSCWLGVVLVVLVPSLDVVSFFNIIGSFWFI